MRKVEGGLRALSTWVEQSKGDYLVQNRLTYADIAVCSVLGFMNVRWPQHNWVSSCYTERNLVYVLTGLQ
jgi:glutathione S-transferase